MSVTNPLSALPTLSRTTTRGVLSRARGVRWIVTIWRLLLAVSVFSTAHFPDGQATGDVFEAIEAVVDDVPSETLSTAEPSEGFERAIKVALGKMVKQPDQYFSVERWVAHASDAPSTPSINAAASDHPSDAPGLWLPPPPVVLTPGLRVIRIRVALPPFRAGPTPAPMLRPPARA